VRTSPLTWKKDVVTTLCDVLKRQLKIQYNRTLLTLRDIFTQIVFTFEANRSWKKTEKNAQCLRFILEANTWRLYYNVYTVKTSHGLREFNILLYIASLGKFSLRQW